MPGTVLISKEIERIQHPRIRLSKDERIDKKYWKMNAQKTPAEIHFSAMVVYFSRASSILEEPRLFQQILPEDSGSSILPSGRKQDWNRPN
jgi:hypothetical protein